MKKSTIITISVPILASIACFAILVVGWSMIELRSSNELLCKLALAKPGIHISEISEQLGVIAMA